ncbi:hypothetical protein [Dolosigranulum savutiense]|uniref:Uncharacterized protein n=2 Tax=Dolosigranulum TaxID=29393 RepID=A0AB74U1N1_9LACT
MMNPLEDNALGLELVFSSQLAEEEYTQLKDRLMNSLETYLQLAELDGEVTITRSE